MLYIYNIYNNKDIYKYVISEYLCIKNISIHKLRIQSFINLRINLNFIFDILHDNRTQSGVEGALIMGKINNKH